MFDEIISKIKTGEAGVSTDTRTIKTDDVFFAIKGEQFDGHNFVIQALEKGASFCVVQEDFNLNTESNPNLNETRLIRVGDTVDALQQLAREYRATLDIPVIAITGCNGKTTTKNFLASVLAQKYKAIDGVEKVAYTKGNLNNFIGLPLTVLSIRPTHEVAVLELGSNHPGEIALLSEIAKPKYGITTSIGSAHIEFFGTLEAIAEEEGFIASVLPKDGLYAVPKHDQYAEYLLKRTSARKSVVDIKSVECLGVDFINFESRLNEIGIKAPHIVADALLVTTIAHELGVNADLILKGLAETKNDKGRFSPERVDIASTSNVTNPTGSSEVNLKTSITIIDDTYNGNPDSVISAIKAMNILYPNERKIVALGCLKELGEYLHTGYERIMNVCNEFNVAEIILINIEDIFEGSEKNDDSGTKIIRVKNNIECAEYIKKHALPDDVILCKGSHGAKTWEVVDGLF